jgi:hypothetical protein
MEHHPSRSRAPASPSSITMDGSSSDDAATTARGVYPVADNELIDIDWFTLDQLPETEIMTADLPAVRHALSSTTSLLID